MQAHLFLTQFEAQLAQPLFFLSQDRILCKVVNLIPKSWNPYSATPIQPNCGGLLLPPATGRGASRRPADQVRFEAATKCAATRRGGVAATKWRRTGELQPPGGCAASRRPAAPEHWSSRATDTERRAEHPLSSRSRTRRSSTGRR